MHIIQPMPDKQVITSVQSFAFCLNEVKYIQWGIAPSHDQKRLFLFVNCNASPVCEDI